LVEGGQYVVGEGDSLFVIAKQFGVKQSDLEKVNSLGNPNKLRVGQKLLIPQAEEIKSEVGNVSAQRPAFISPKSRKLISTSNDMYTIKDGDTVEKIANEIGVSQSELMSTNSLDKNSILQPGKKLLIPQKKMADVKMDSMDSTMGENFFDRFEEIPVIEINN
jgi:LysM repeat protein